MMAAMSTPAGPRPGPPGRLRMTAYAAAQLALAVPALVLFILTVVGGALSLVAIGIPLLFLTLPANRWEVGNLSPGDVRRGFNPNASRIEIPNQKVVTVGRGKVNRRPGRPSLI